MDISIQTPKDEAVSEAAAEYNTSPLKQDRKESTDGKSLPFEEGKRYAYTDLESWPEQIDGRYNVKVYNGPQAIPVHILEGCVIDFAEVFDFSGL